ncbi:hypothetical protein V8C86DRAFT_2450566 [Haematococcus lacustris]
MCSRSTGVPIAWPKGGGGVGGAPARGVVTGLGTLMAWPPAGGPPPPTPPAAKPGGCPGRGGNPLGGGGLSQPCVGVPGPLWAWRPGCCSRMAGGCPGPDPDPWPWGAPDSRLRPPCPAAEAAAGGSGPAGGRRGRRRAFQRSSAVAPAWLRTCASWGSRSSSSFMALAWPWRAAQCSAVQPSSSCSLGSAPRFSSSRTIALRISSSELLLPAARCRAQAPRVCALFTRRGCFCTPSGHPSWRT